MDFKLAEEALKLKGEIKSFAEKELPEDWLGPEVQYDDATFPFTRTISPKLARNGWLTMAWPKGYRSREASADERFVYIDETSYQGIPGCDMGIGGVGWVGPSLVRFGSEEQKKRHLPGIASGEVFWCTGYSEPGSGSDLASLQTRAVADGDDYLISGQKVWTSAAHIADWLWVLVRTDPNVAPHKGLSLFLVPMKSKGLTVGNLISPDGVHHFNELFFDNVRVPAGNLVGEKNRGWYQVVVSLDMERATPGVRMSGESRRSLDEAISFLNESGRRMHSGSEFSVLQREAAELAIEVCIGHLLAHRVVWMNDTGRQANAEASLCKLYTSELLQRVTDFGTRVLGKYGDLLASSKYARLHGRMALNHMAALGHTIAAGTSEVQRNIIAQRGLGLPR